VRLGRDTLESGRERQRDGPLASPEEWTDALPARAGSRALADLVPASGSTLLVQRGASLETVTPVPGSSSSSR
jgi:hypothetical protein